MTIRNRIERLARSAAAPDAVACAIRLMSDEELTAIVNAPSDDGIDVIKLSEAGGKSQGPPEPWEGGA